MSRPPLANQYSTTTTPSGHHQHHSPPSSQQPPPVVQPSSSTPTTTMNRVNSSSAIGMTMNHSTTDRDSLGIDDRRSEVSGAGYSAYSGHRANDDVPNYHMRLVRFYQKYNPEKIPRVPEFLEAYKGDEEELFRTLSSKYGPEPEPSVLSVGSRSETTTARESRQIGVATVPKVVSPGDGNCDRDTPYYPSQRTIMESDLCNLLATKKTTHPDLVAAFVGYLTAHPSAAWNGMTYITNVPVPIDEESRFLGHLWAGSLSNTKTIIHDKVPFTRTVFHCGENCSSSHWVHERWRLTLIRADHTQDTLYRVLWDPVLSPAAAAELLKAAPNAVEQDRNSFFSFFKRQGSEKGSMKSGPLPSKSVHSSGFSSRSQQHAASATNQQQQHQNYPPPVSSSAGNQPLPAYPPPSTLAPNTSSSTTTAQNPQQPTQPSSSANPHQSQHLLGPNHHHATSSSSATPIPLQPTNTTSGAHQQQQPPIISSTTRSSANTNNIPQQPVTASANPTSSSTAQQQHQHHNQPPPQQPQQPQMVSSFDSLINLVQGLEGRLTERLSDLDKRLQAVESDIVFLKEMNEQRQIEQLPEPWLDDGGTSHQGSSVAVGRAHKKIKKEVSMKEKAHALQRHRRKQHRKRLEQERNRLENDAVNHDDDGTETVLTTSVGTSVGTSGYH